MIESLDWLLSHPTDALAASMAIYGLALAVWGVYKLD